MDNTRFLSALNSCSKLISSKCFKDYLLSFALLGLYYLYRLYLHIDTTKCGSSILILWLNMFYKKYYIYVYVSIKGLPDAFTFIFSTYHFCFHFIRFTLCLQTLKWLQCISSRLDLTIETKYLFLLKANILYKIL